jgi:hypothetical protein
LHLGIFDPPEDEKEAPLRGGPSSRRSEEQKSGRADKKKESFIHSALHNFLASHRYGWANKGHNTGVGDDRPLFFIQGGT